MPFWSRVSLYGLPSKPQHLRRISRGGSLAFGRRSHEGLAIWRCPAVVGYLGAGRDRLSQRWRRALVRRPRDRSGRPLARRLRRRSAGGEDAGRGALRLLLGEVLRHDASCDIGGLDAPSATVAQRDGERDRGV